MANFRSGVLSVFAWLLLVDVCLSEYTPLVKTVQGKVRGRISLLTGQYQYLGIPYAVSERFQSPQQPPRWRGIFYATDPLVLCPQKIILPMGSENCTVLNVYAPPNTQPDGALPVMVFIHGGSFFYGSGSVTNFDPAYLVGHGVIVVTVNYRLGIFGFLCLGIEGARGNMGMKDQVAALRWIRENIKAFGGNSDRVTIFGESAGAASVHMHMLSKSSRGLFKGLIMQSGSAIAPWAINLDPVSSAREDALKLGVVSSDPYEILVTFRKMPLVRLLHIAKDSVLNNNYKYCPCVEKGRVHDDEPFLTETPYNLMKTGSFARVPVLMGVNSAEGIFFAGLHNYKTIRTMDQNFADFVPKVFDWDTVKQKRDFMQMLRRFYFKNESIMKTDIGNLVNFYSDSLISNSVPKISEIITSISDSPVYNYLFSYDGGRNFVKYFMGINMKGVSHADELFYIFKPSSIPLPIYQKDNQIIKRMTSMWTNFAKTGNPTPMRTSLLPVKWEASTKNRTIYMNIDSKMSMIRQPFRKRTEFWEELFRLYGIEGVAPVDTICATFPVTTAAKENKFLFQVATIQLLARQQRGEWVK